MCSACRVGCDARTDTAEHLREPGQTPVEPTNRPDATRPDRRVITAQEPVFAFSNSSSSSRPLDFMSASCCSCSVIPFGAARPAVRRPGPVPADTPARVVGHTQARPAAPDRRRHRLRCQRVCCRRETLLDTAVAVPAITAYARPSRTAPWRLHLTLFGGRLERRDDDVGRDPGLVHNPGVGGEQRRTNGAAQLFSHTISATSCSVQPLRATATSTASSGRRAGRRDRRRRDPVPRQALKFDRAHHAVRVLYTNSQSRPVPFH